MSPRATALGRVAAVVLTLSLAPPASAGLFGLSESSDGGQPGAFLQAAMSARPLAMGGAHTAVADDATAPFWNASGLSQIQRYDAVTYFSRLGEDASLGAGAFAVPTQRLGTFSFNYIGLRSGSFKGRDASNRDLGNFSNDASALLLSHGLAFSPRWSGGYSLKAIRESVAGFSDTGYGADVGLLFRPHPLWQAGFAVQNIVRPSLALKNTAETLPTEMRLGGKFDPTQKLTLALDSSFIRNRGPRLSVGLEWRAVEPLAFRVGANDREITAGIGFPVGTASLDYAFGFPNGRAVREELGLSHRVSLHLRFGRNVMAGSYRDLSRRQEEQRHEILAQDTGVDHVKALRRRMPGWNEKLDAQTFADVQAARESLRELAFQEPMKSLEAQAYISHFQGRYQESARLFGRLADLQPSSRRIRKHGEIAQRRFHRTPSPIALAAAYDALDAQYRGRRQEMLAARAQELRIASAQARAESAGGAGSAREPAESGRGPSFRTAPQLAFLSPGTMPPLARPQPVQRPVPPPPVQKAPPPAAPAAPAAEPEEPAAAPVPAEKPAPAQRAPEPVAPPAAPVRPAAPEAVAPPPPPPPPPASVPAAPTKPVMDEAQKSFQSGDYVQSYLLSREALKQDPGDRSAARQAILTNAVVSAQAGLTDPKAGVDMERLQAQVNSSMSMYERAATLNGDGRRDEALVLLDEAVQTCPANYLARDLVRQINTDAEEEKWRKMLNSAKGYR